MNFRKISLLKMPGKIKDWVQIALEHQGAKYVRYRSPEAGVNPENGFDCSGFQIYNFRQANFPLPIVQHTGLEVRHTEEFFD